MAKSANSRRLEAVVRRIDEAHLNSLGFRLSGSTFRHEIEPGFIQIIDFGLGQSWSTFHGQFTVDVCLFIAEAYEVFFDTTSPRRPTATHCELCQRLGLLGSPPKDVWWPVSLPPDSLAVEVGGEIQRLALPFLARIANRRAFVDSWFSSGNDALGLTPRGDLVVAAVLTQLGDRDAAERLLNASVVQSKGKPFEEFCVKTANKIKARQS